MKGSMTCATLTVDEVVDGKVKSMSIKNHAYPCYLPECNVEPLDDDTVHIPSDEIESFINGAE
jgi:SET domain-containing protein